VRKCQSCGYLILGEVDSCQNCGTELGTASVGAFTAAAAASTSAAPASPPSPPWMAAAPPPAYGMTPPSVPSAPEMPQPQAEMFGATSWAPAPVITMKRRGNPRAAIAVVMVMFLACAAIGYTVLAHRNALPAGTSDFVAGKGVTYSPDDSAYTAQFPEQPETDSVSRKVGPINLSVNLAMVTKSDYELGIGELQLPGIVPNSKIDDMLKSAVQEGMNEAQGTVQSEQRIQIEGLPALEARVKGPDGYSVRVLAVVGVHHMFILIVHSKSATDRLYDALKTSFVAND
jgi:hypothetical protein